MPTSRSTMPLGSPHLATDLFRDSNAVVGWGGPSRGEPSTSSSHNHSHVFQPRSVGLECFQPRWAACQNSTPWSSSMWGGTGGALWRHLPGGHRKTRGRRSSAGGMGASRRSSAGGMGALAPRLCHLSRPPSSRDFGAQGSMPPPGSCPAPAKFVSAAPSLPQRC